MRRMCFMLLLFAASVPAQDVNQTTNSFFDDSEMKTFSLTSILVEGEVENPGPVDLSGLPVRNCPVKEVALIKDKPEFKGAFFYSGYSLYDILNGKKVRKAGDNSFSPFVDLYVIVENGMETRSLSVGARSITPGTTSRSCSQRAFRPSIHQSST